MHQSTTIVLHTHYTTSLHCTLLTQCVLHVASHIYCYNYIYVQVCYGPAVRTQSSRRLLISNTTPLLQSTHGKSLLLSGGLDSSVYARSPLDVANLGQLIGLTELAARNAVSRNATAVLLRAQARRAKFKGIELQLPEVGISSSHNIADLTVPAQYYLPQAREVAGQKAAVTAGTTAGGSSSNTKQQKRSDDVNTATAATNAAIASSTTGADDYHQDDVHDDNRDGVVDETAGTGYLALDELSDSDMEQETIL
jgi:RNase P subunit p30